MLNYFLTYCSAKQLTDGMISLTANEVLPSPFFDFSPASKVGHTWIETGCVPIDDLPIVLTPDGWKSFVDLLGDPTGAREE